MGEGDIVKKSIFGLAAAILTFAALAVCVVPTSEAEANAAAETQESRRVLPDVYREAARNYAKALAEGYDSGLCDDSGSDEDLGGGIIYDGFGEAALARVGWTTIDVGGEASLFVVGADASGKDRSYVYGVWRASGGAPQKMIVCSYRNTITLHRRDDGALMLCLTGSQHAGFFYENWREVKADDLPFVVSVVYDEVDDPEHPWRLDGERCDEARANSALDAIAKRCEPVKLDFSPFSEIKERGAPAAMPAAPPAFAAVPDIEVVTMRIERGAGAEKFEQDMPQAVLRNASELPELASAIEAFDRRAADHVASRLAEVRERFKDEIDTAKISYELSELSIDRADERMVSLRAIFLMCGIGAVIPSLTEVSPLIFSLTTSRSF